MFDPSSYIRAHLDQLSAYTPIEPYEVLSARMGRLPDDIVKLDANENPYGPSPEVRQVLSSLPYPHIYPDPESRELRAALSTFSGVPAENLIAGAGADELIDLLLRVFVEPGDSVVYCPPTFGMYAFDTRLNAGNPVEVQRNSDFSLGIVAIRNAVREHKAKILFLAVPNNPDGSIPNKEDINDLLDLPVLLVLDEAYIEFSDSGGLGETATRMTKSAELGNLVVLRTFSKWAGLAGLRVGYGAFPGWLIPVLWKVKQPYSVSVAASAAAIASIKDRVYLAGVVSQIREERARLFAALSAIPAIHPYPSQANFILCRLRNTDALELKTILAMRYGILVRYFDNPRLRDHIRISVGRPEDTDLLIHALNEVLR